MVANKFERISGVSDTQQRVNPSRAVDENRAVPRLGPDTAARLASAGVLAAVALAGAWFGGWLAVALVCVVVVIVHLEWIRLTGDAPTRATVATAVLVVGLAAAGAGFAWAGLGLAALAVIGAAVSAGGLWRPLGVAYAAMLGFGLLLLRLAPEFGFEYLAPPDEDNADLGFSFEEAQCGTDGDRCTVVASHAVDRDANGHPRP